MKHPALKVHRIGPNAGLQDQGREGFLAFGLSRGGAADRLALAEGGALLGQGAGLAALEMPAMGGQFEALADIRIALTGAEMRAELDGAGVQWNASHSLPKGSKLTLGSTQGGGYGYLHLGGGFAGDMLLGSYSVQIASGLGRVVAAGDILAGNPDQGGATGFRLPQDARFKGGELRVVPGLQTSFFDAAQLKRFQDTKFVRDTRANRMGVRMASDGDGFHVDGGLNVVSEIVVPGDIQVTGDGAPYVLLSECQTTGGYPRIGTVLPCDLPKVAQAPPGAELRFRFVDLPEALRLTESFDKLTRGLPGKTEPMVRDPHDIADLLSYQLISGATAGDTEL